MTKIASILLFSTFLIPTTNLFSNKNEFSHDDMDFRFPFTVTAQQTAQEEEEEQKEEDAVKKKKDKEKEEKTRAAHEEARQLQIKLALLQQHHTSGQSKGR